MAAVEAAKTCIYLRRLLAEFGENIEGPVTLYGDNKATITVATGIDAAIFTRMRHIDVKSNWLYEQCLGKQIRFEYIKSEENLADIFTKNVSTQTYEYLRGKLMRKEKQTLDNANIFTWLDKYLSNTNEEEK